MPRFARSIVHDLKNPLNIIGLTSELFGKADAPAQFRASAQARIQKQMVRINDLITDILQFTQGDQVTARAPMNYARVFHNSVVLPNGQVVIIGGHFDSFHAATGATDNGGACSALMEAMRLLALTNTPLKRTVRLCLWNGEEQGLIGSRLYVAEHFGGVRGSPTPAYDRGEVVPIKCAHSRFQAYFNLDNGAGSIRGVHNQGNKAVVPVFRQWMEPEDFGGIAVYLSSNAARFHTGDSIVLDGGYTIY